MNKKRLINQILKQNKTKKIMEQQDIQFNTSLQKGIYEQAGQDEKGTVYKNIQDMWEKEILNKNLDQVKEPIGGRQKWYGKQVQYWESQESSVNGMLGGFQQLDTPDIKHSNQFIQHLFQNHNMKNDRVIDMGAGIGRITKNLLSKLFKIVDVADQSKTHVEQSKQYLKDVQNVQHFITSGIQDIQLQEKYDCLWVQWVVIYLTDDDFIKFLKDSKKNLNENGIIVIKENMTKTGFVVDKDDNSVTRSEEIYKYIFDQAGYNVIYDSLQTDFPKELYAVKAFALKPKQ